MIAIPRELDECIEKIDEKKVMSQKTSNLLKDMEYDSRVLKEEICENLEEENDEIVKE